MTSGNAFRGVISRYRVSGDKGLRRGVVLVRLAALRLCPDLSFLSFFSLSSVTGFRRGNPILGEVRRGSRLAADGSDAR